MEHELEWIRVAWHYSEYLREEGEETYSTYRAKVPGGWLYRHVQERRAVAMVFVPDPAAR